MARLTADELARMSMAERHEAVRHVLGRRGLLRAGAAGAASLGAGAVLLAPGAGAVTSAAVPLLARWLAFGEDPRTQVRVRWQVGGQVTGPAVRFGTDARYGSDVPAALDVLRTVMPNGRVVEQWYAGATLGGLEPGTTYHYQVVHDGGVDSADATFRTAPAATDRSAFRFTAFGDQSVTRWATSVDTVLGRFDPAFHLLAGDISYADMSGQGIATNEYDPYRWDEYFRQIEPVAASVPWMVAAGNHDMEALFDQHGYGGLLRRFAIPSGGPAGCPTAYSFRYGRVGFLVADSNDLSYELRFTRDFSQGRQVGWAESVLAGFRADPDVDFVVAVLHHCAFATSKAHVSDGGVRDSLVPLFDRYEVDLVVSGHNHVYERTDPLRAGVVAVEAPAGARIASDDAGTTYVCAGGGGMGLTDFGVSDRNRMVRDTAPTEFESAVVVPDGTRTKETVGWSRARYTGHSFIVVDVDPGPVGTAPTMNVRMVTMDGAVLDEVTLVRTLPTWLRRHRAEVLAAAGGVVAAGLAGAVVLARRSDRSEPSEPSEPSELVVPAGAGEPVEPTAQPGPPAPNDPLEPAGPPAPAVVGLADLDGPDGFEGLVRVAHALLLAEVGDDVECFESDDARYLDVDWLPWPFAAGVDDLDDLDDLDELDELDGPDDPGADPAVRTPDVPAQRRPAGPAAASAPPRDGAGSPPRP